MTERLSLRAALPGVALIVTIVLAMACAGRGPEVLTNTPDEVAIEFPKNGDLGDATELANEACAKHGRIARFGVVKTAATPTTRVAKYRCVSPDVAAPAASDEQPAAQQQPATPASTTEEPAAAADEGGESAPAVEEPETASPPASQ